MVTFSFDDYTKIITVDIAYDEATCQEIYNACRDYEDEPHAMSYYKIVDGSGKQDLGGGVSVGITITLIDWKIKFADRAGPSWVDCSITGGNLVTYDTVGEEYINPIQGATFVNVTLTASSSATQIQQDAIQYGSFDRRVCLDSVNGTSGTAYPQGTRQYPVDNLADAKVILTANGLAMIELAEDYTFGATDNIDDITIVGKNPETVKATITSGCSTQDTSFIHIEIEGTLSGMVFINTDTHIGNLNNLEGHVHNAILEGDILVTGTGQIDFISCVSGVPGTGTPVIDMGGSGTDFALRGYSGGIEIKNCSGAQNVSLDFLSGHAKLDSSVTNGTFVIRGSCRVTDDSTGTTIVRTTLDDVIEVLHNKLTIDEGNSKLQLWNKTGTVVIWEWPITDKDASSVVLTGTGPANRGVSGKV